MIGAILGDIVGSPYEFHNIKKENFPLIQQKSRYTDDTVMTLAVARSLMDGYGKMDEEITEILITNMKKYGRMFPDAGYGGMFYKWLMTEETKPYNSFGNGSAMRVSSVGWLYPTMEETLHMAALTAGVTHNHPGGIAEAYYGMPELLKEECLDILPKELRKIAEEFTKTQKALPLNHCKTRDLNDKF